MRRKKVIKCWNNILKVKVFVIILHQVMIHVISKQKIVKVALNTHEKSDWIWALRRVDIPLVSLFKEKLFNLSDMNTPVNLQVELKLKSKQVIAESRRWIKTLANTWSKSHFFVFTYYQWTNESWSSETSDFSRDRFMSCVSSLLPHWSTFVPEQQRPLTSSRLSRRCEWGCWRPH